MKANLIVFNTEEGQENSFNFICPTIQQKMNICTVELSETTVFSNIQFIMEKLSKHLESFSVIAWDFENVGFNSEDIINILSSKYVTQPLAWEGGWYLNSNIGKCLVIDTGKQNFEQHINPNIMTRLFDFLVPCAYVKVFGLEKSEILKLYSQIPNNNQFSCTIYTNYLVGELSILNNNNLPKEYVDEFLRNLYIQFQDYWFSDNEETLLQKLDELLVLRNVRFCVADGLTNGVFEEFLMQGLQGSGEYITNIFTMSTLEQYAKTIHISPDFLATHEKNSVEMAYEMSAVMMEQGLADVAISLCGTAETCYISVGDNQAVHLYKYNFNHNPNYIYKIVSRQAVFKLLKKLRENHLYFLENGV